MTDDREQDRKGRKDASRPVTAAARRERRASNRADGGVERSKPSAKADAKPDAVKRSASKRADSKDGKAGATKAETEGKGKPTQTRDRKAEKVSLLGRLLRFLREVVAELRKVIWPTRKQLITYTVVVLIFVAFMVALIFALDLAFHEAVFRVFG